MLRDQRLKLGDEGVVVPEREPCVHALLDRGHPKLLEALDLGPRERLVGAVRERIAAPERERLIEERVGLCGPAGRVRTPTLREQALEPAHVDPLRLDLERIPARARHEQLGRPEQFSQPRDLMVEAVARGSGRPLAPELVDQPVARNNLVGVEEEDREEGALLRTADRDHPLVLPDLERPE